MVILTLLLTGALIFLNFILFFRNVGLFKVNFNNQISLFILFQAKYLTKKTQAGSVEAIRVLDELLLQLVVSLLCKNLTLNPNLTYNVC